MARMLGSGPGSGPGVLHWPVPTSLNLRDPGCEVWTGPKSSSYWSLGSLLGKKDLGVGPVPWPRTGSSRSC